jgi:hypothetical protein
MPRRDAAEGGVMGELIAIALGVAGAAALFFLLGGFGSGQEVPAAIGFNDEGATSDDTHELRVSRSLSALDWDALTLLLDGCALEYSETLDDDGTFCIAHGSGDRVASASAVPIQGGDTVRVRGAALGRKTFVVRQDGANALLYAHTF